VKRSEQPWLPARLTATCTQGDLERIAAVASDLPRGTFVMEAVHRLLFDYETSRGLRTPPDALLSAAAQAAGKMSEDDFVNAARRAWLGRKARRG